MNRRTWRSAAGVVIASFVALGLPALAHAGPPPDFNGDGRADLAVGIPGKWVGGIALAGAVNVIYGSLDKLKSSDSQLFTQEDFNIPATLAGQFGVSLAWGDFNQDTMTDLAIGAPRPGSVFVLYGRSSGLSLESSQAFVTTCESVGGALAVGDFDADGYDDLAVGAPFCSLEVPGGGFVPGIPAVKASGLVGILWGGREGVFANWEFPQTLLDFKLERKRGDYFGAALAAADFNGDGHDDLAVGIPNRDFTSIVVDAGAVALYYGRERNLGLRPGNVMFQENGGVHVNEAGDHFGRALAAGYFNSDRYADLAVGVPLEDVGSIVNAGEVTVYLGRSVGVLPLVGHSHWHQDLADASNAIEDRAEAGDNFGATVAAGDFNGDGYSDLAVGVPFENLGAVANAGAVHVILSSRSGLRLLDNRFFTEESIDRQRDDAFGNSLAVGDFDASGHDDLAIGVPGENTAGVPNAGAMHVLYGRDGGLTASGRQVWSQDSPGIPGDPEPGDVFGNGRYGHIH